MTFTLPESRGWLKLCHSVLRAQILEQGVLMMIKFGKIFSISRSPHVEGFKMRAKLGSHLLRLMGLVHRGKIWTRWHLAAPPRRAGRGSAQSRQAAQPAEPEPAPQRPERRMPGGLKGERPSAAVQNAAVGGARLSRSGASLQRRRVALLHGKWVPLQPVKHEGLGGEWAGVCVAKV